EALLELGPSGYPFEKFIGELLNRLGYQTDTGVIVDGNCVSHEIDVIAEKDDEHFMIECKFHNRKAHKCNVKTPLYIQSRFRDVERNWRSQPGHEDKQHQGWLVTNTRFTTDARQYGKCVGLKLLSWDYPENDGLKDLISHVNLHPVTSLSTLSNQKKKLLLEQNVVFCKQICEDKQVLKSIGLDNHTMNKVFEEAMDICNVKNNSVNR
ncbi:MAG: restriction endonuclease, partial [Candidatus Halalkalibacterium sp. M3_1C_030]